MKRLSLLLLNLVIGVASAADVGSSIYMKGTDGDGQAIRATINGLESKSALSCANCHRESGIGTSESGRTIPPVAWRLLGVNQPENDQSRFYNIQNKRPAYTPALVHRLLTTGIKSNGEMADPLMPRYEIGEQQTGQLIEYLKTLFPDDDPGVDGDTLQIATIVDARLPEDQVRQHLAFIEGLFAMKNSGTRGELRRKEFAPIQKAPQYEAYRKWALQTWVLPADTSQWAAKLQQYYRAQPVFVVLAPLVQDNYQPLREFCSAHEVPCLFPHAVADSHGDYFNFVFRDTAKQRRDFLAATRRKATNDLLYVDTAGEVRALGQDQTDVPTIGVAGLNTLGNRFGEICTSEATLLLAVDQNTAPATYQLACPGEQRLKIMLFAAPSIGYADIAAILHDNSNPHICWVTDYDRVLKRNTREIRISLLARRFGISNPAGETLARDLFAFGLLSDSVYQLTGNFSRAYLLENMEHMLNSFPNYTYFSNVSGAPYQRAIVGPLKEFCPGPGAAS